MLSQDKCLHFALVLVLEQHCGFKMIFMCHQDPGDTGQYCPQPLPGKLKLPTALGPGVCSPQELREGRVARLQGCFLVDMLVPHCMTLWWHPLHACPLFDSDKIQGLTLAQLCWQPSPTQFQGCGHSKATTGHREARGDTASQRAPCLKALSLF